MKKPNRAFRILVRATLHTVSYSLLCLAILIMIAVVRHGLEGAGWPELTAGLIASVIVMFAAMVLQAIYQTHGDKDLIEMAERQAKRNRLAFDPGRATDPTPVDTSMGRTRPWSPQKSNLIRTSEPPNTGSGGRK